MVLLEISTESGWFFNREYRPIGFNNQIFSGDPGNSFLDLPVYSKFRKISDVDLVELAFGEDGIQRNSKEEVVKIFFYNDGTNPSARQANDRDWENYFCRIKKLSILLMGE